MRLLRIPPRQKVRAALEHFHWPQMTSGHLRWSQVALDGLRWPPVVSGGLGWPRIASGGLGWPWRAGPLPSQQNIRTGTGTGRVQEPLLPETGRSRKGGCSFLCKEPASGWGFHTQWSHSLTAIYSKSALDTRVCGPKKENK